MLHEVLVALVGCPGYLIRARPDGYELAPGVAETFLHPAEASLVAQICALGHHFRALEDFVARVKGDLLLHPLDGALGGVAGGGAVGRVCDALARRSRRVDAARAGAHGGAAAALRPAAALRVPAAWRRIEMFGFSLDRSTPLTEALIACSLLALGVPALLAP